MAEYGLLVRGGFHADARDGAPDGVQTVLLIGNAGPAQWQAMSEALKPGADPMNRWTQDTVGPIAEEFGAKALYPFGDPPYYPFQRWAKRAEDVASSPLGILIHPDYGLWHAYRAALCFEDQIPIPVNAGRPSPCETCADQPCLSTCPVGAFTVDQGYNVPDCADHLRTPDGSDCLGEGCRARRACPIGVDYRYMPEQAAFHMHAFLRARYEP